MHIHSSGFNWWQHGVLYQVYPRSFQDSNNDGVGDLRGIIQRLDYIQDLGVAGIWFNPFFKSPKMDFGYDISDYRQVDPLFGTNEDLLELIQQCKKRNLKVVLDMVLNHTSDQHPWFVESRSSKDNPKRDWYIWHNSPNNWIGIFGGSAWEFCPETQEYYYHAFLKEQPDLNLRNPEVVAELKNLFRYYLEMGVDGFRLDAVNTYFEDEMRRDNPAISPSNIAPHITQKWVYNYDHQLNFTLLDELSAVVAEYDDRMIMGEVGRDGSDVDAWKTYYGSCNMRLDLVFNFDLLYGEFTPLKLANTIQLWETLPECKWPTYASSSHDQVRGVSRILTNTTANLYQKSTLLATTMLCLRGTPFVYYGEEIGLEQSFDLPKNQIRDPLAIRNNYLIEGRDGCRTPMKWDHTLPNAGFSTTAPWLPINDTHWDINVNTQLGNPHSILHWYRSLIKLRNETPALYKGEIEILESAVDTLLIKRSYEQEEVYIFLNFSEKDVEIPTILLNQHVLITTSSLQNILSPYSVIIV
jgi:alpha-glucosidase